MLRKAAFYENLLCLLKPLSHQSSILTECKKSADCQGARSMIASISAAMQWHRNWKLWDHIELRWTARTSSMLKSNAVATPLLKSAVGAPYGRHSRAVRSPTMQGFLLCQFGTQYRPFLQLKIEQKLSIMINYISNLQFGENSVKIRRK